MRIGMVVRRLTTQGGTERFGHGFAQWLLKAGHSVDVWCAAVDVPIEGVHVRQLNAGGRGVNWKALRLAMAAGQVPSGEYDAVLHLVRGGRGGVYRAGGGCHAVWAEQGAQPWTHALQTHLDRKSVQQARRVVVNSRLVQHQLIDRYGVGERVIRLVRNGVDLVRFHPDGPGMDSGPRQHVVFLGSDFARKGLATAIRAMVNQPQLDLWVLGGGRSAAYIRLARRLGVLERVRFLGEVMKPEQYLRGAAALMLPTRYDPSANATLEAMACGVPVLSTLADGASELLPEPWMVISDPMDVDGFAEGLSRVLDRPALGERCREVAEAHGAHGAFQGLLSVLEEAVA